jgi:hypothetical protein
MIQKIKGAKTRPKNTIEKEISIKNSMNENERAMERKCISRTPMVPTINVIHLKNLTKGPPAFSGR